MQLKSLNGQPILWQPLPKQQLVMSCPARECLYGGEKGSGKSDLLVGCWLPILNLAHQKFVDTGRLQHRCRIVIFRKNLDDLKDIITKSRDLYPYFDPAMGIDGYNINDKTWTFTSGATVAFRHLDGPKDHEGFQGNELVGIGFDEVQYIPEEAYKFLSWQLRSKDPDYHRLRMIRCTANPGGEDWIIPHFFIDRCPEGGKIFEVKDPTGKSEFATTRAFIKAKLTDNPYLPPDYRAQMAANMTEDEIAQYLEGDWFRVAGSFFSKFLRKDLHFVRSRPVPSSWEFRHSLDWGSTAPAAWLMGARDEDGRVWIVDEMHGPGVTGRLFGERLQRKFESQAWCKDKKFDVGEIWGSVDKQALDRYGSDASAADGIMDWGFRFFPAQKDRASGINQIKERLLLDRHGNPQMVIFEDRCPNLVKALSAIKSQAPKNPDDYDDGSQYSHVIDALRFMLMEFPLHPRDEVDPRDKAARDWDRFLAKARMRQQQRGADDSYGNGTGYE